MQNISSSAAFADSKPHYELLDGLRGIAALLVIWYHIFEGFATSPIDQRFNHGYWPSISFLSCRDSLLVTLMTTVGKQR